LKGVLVRVGIDSSCGFWNAPCDPQTKRFVYVPIPEGDGDLHPELIHHYDEVLPFLDGFGVPLPLHLTALPMHLDPDFEMLTYGDVFPRSLPLLDLRAGDFIVFYASFKSLEPTDGELVYALIGFFSIKEVVNADDVPQERWRENAHTRRWKHGRDVIIRATTADSGRFDRAIPIGEHRDRAYRVKREVLENWGGLTVKDGYLQRSGRLPEFLKPEQFLKWLKIQGRELHRRNNL